ncbi:MAG: nucleotide sugar dehydrogenase [Bacteroidota bacterium]
MFEQLSNKTCKLAVVGLGYVGLPVALEFAKHFSVIGFDINEARVNMMKEGKDPSCELESSDFDDKEIQFCHLEDEMKEANFFVVAVPTPIDEFKQPNLAALRGASSSVARVLKKGDYVVFESTVYPGCTEEVCVPILEEISGLKCNQDFKVGYSPERINPGDKKNTIDKIVKIVSGSDEEALDNIAKVYGSIITAGIHQAPTIKVAEAAKIVENTQRDVNIALMNELSTIFEKMGVNTYDVLQAAGTKWNFLHFYPGLVGGHCIGVDPYYLIQKSIRVGHNPILISAGRAVNDGMPGKIAQKMVQELKARGKNPMECKLLVQGITFKENVTDIRNSKAADLVLEMMNCCMQVDVVDPEADPKEVRQHYGIEMTPTLRGKYDAVIVAVSHQAYMEMEESDYQMMMKPDAFMMDIKGIMKDKITGMDYFSL